MTLDIDPKVAPARPVDEAIGLARHLANPWQFWLRGETGERSQ